VNRLRLGKVSRLRRWPALAAVAAAALALPAGAQTPGDAKAAAPKPATTAVPTEAPRARPTPTQRPVPLSERTAVIAALDKRLGTTAEFTLKPGERFTFGRLQGVLRSCERTQSFERKQSAAFVQLVEQPPAGGGRAAPGPVLIFSGWLFAESPSLNPVTHPVYDVWLKSCTMRFPDGPKAPSSSTGRKGPSAAAGGKPASSAPAAPAAPAAAPSPAPADPTT